MPHSPFDRAENPSSERLPLAPAHRRPTARGEEEQRETTVEKEERVVEGGRKRRETGKAGRVGTGEQMEVGESRNKRYVNPRNGAVYSFRKKVDKTSFRSGRRAPGPSPLPAPRSPPYHRTSVPPALPLASLPAGRPLGPGKMTVNKSPRGIKNARTRGGRDGRRRGRGGTATRSPFIPAVLRLPTPSSADGFPEAERNRSAYCPELIPRLLGPPASSRPGASRSHFSFLSRDGERG